LEFFESTISRCIWLNHLAFYLNCWELSPPIVSVRAESIQHYSTHYNSSLEKADLSTLASSSASVSTERNVSPKTRFLKKQGQHKTRLT
jgi:hypothetical protein